LSHSLDWEIEGGEKEGGVFNFLVNDRSRPEVLKGMLSRSSPEKGDTVTRGGYLTANWKGNILGGKVCMSPMVGNV